MRYSIFIKTTSLEVEKTPSPWMGEGAIKTFTNLSNLGFHEHSKYNRIYGSTYMLDLHDTSGCQDT